MNMYLIDLLFRLAPGVYVRIKFDGSDKTFCFTTGERKTRTKIAELSAQDRAGAVVREIIPLYHAQELYIVCC